MFPPASSPLPVLLAVTLPLAALYGVFLWWWGGRGRPLTPAEVEQGLQALRAAAAPPPPPAAAEALLAGVRQLLAGDDGREFVMVNLVRHRARAAYPPGERWAGLGDDPREADRRYGRAIVPHLLRQGSLPLFIARRSGRLFEPPGAEAWHYVALVRYRSRRDFLHFALAIERAGIAVHKWAAIETTQVFPTRPMLSLITVRATVAAALLLLGAGLLALATGGAAVGA